ncbi:hypothetical protein KH388_21495 [Serratia rubidaea]|nr:hypothetical protein [Serratia rubidaea]
MTDSVIKSVKISKAHNGKIPVTLMVDDIELANDIYKKCRDEFNVEVEVDEETLKSFNDDEMTTQQRVIEKAKTIKSKQEK